MQAGNIEDICIFSVDILEVVLLARGARTAGTTSATTNAVRCDFSAQRLGPWVLEVVVVAGCNLLGLAKQRLLQVAGKIERLLLQLEVGAKRLSWGSVNSACSTKIFIYDYHLWYRLYVAKSCLESTSRTLGCATLSSCKPSMDRRVWTWQIYTFVQPPLFKSLARYALALINRKSVLTSESGIQRKSKSCKMNPWLLFNILDKIKLVPAEGGAHRTTSRPEIF